MHEQEPQHESQWAAITSVAAKIGCSGETLRKWVRQGERDVGTRAGLTTDEQARVKALEREVKELRRANGVGVFRPSGARPPRDVMVRFVEDHRATYGVEHICHAIEMAPSTFYEHHGR